MWSVTPVAVVRWKVRHGLVEGQPAETGNLILPFPG